MDTDGRVLKLYQVLALEPPQAACFDPGTNRAVVVPFTSLALVPRTLEIFEELKVPPPPVPVPDEPPRPPNNGKIEKKGLRK